jgi:hypothetical protein
MSNDATNDVAGAETWSPFKSFSIYNYTTGEVTKTFTVRAPTANERFKALTVANANNGFAGTNQLIMFVATDTNGKSLGLEEIVNMPAYLSDEVHEYLQSFTSERLRNYFASK